VCLRCEAIRSRIEGAAWGGIVEMAAGAQRCMGDDELLRAVWSVLAQRERSAAEKAHLVRRRESASPWGKIGIVIARARRASARG
jgi:hypothetical protein